MTVTDSLLSGDLLSGYRVESTLGRGGMGAVYLAEDPNLQRNVALKVISPEQAQRRVFRDRFLAESQLAASIDHPNIVPIYAAGEAGGTLYIAMRYVPGGNLKARIRKQPLDADEAVGILVQIASALDAAHARGLVHRDVKPSNVLLDAGSGMEGVDHAYLADFGLSERIGDRPEGSEPGAMVGTIDYVAPEQIAGQPVDWRADIYALGALLYECLTGAPPFPRSTDLQVVFAHLEADPPSAEAQRPGLPAGLDRVIARAMAKDPDDRYSSCREFARAASAILVEEATRQLSDVASRAAAGRVQLSDTEAELAERVMAVQSALSHRRALSRQNQALEPDLPGVCPFKGLASFGVGDAQYYFGRERLVAQLATRLIRSSFIAIVGASGSGKSSLLQAGLLPALSAGVLPGSALWPQILVRPGDRPAGRLRGALGLAPDRPLVNALDSLGEGERLVVAVDQLEEVFTACDSEQERSGFLSDLNDLATDRQGRAVVVTAMRADYYGHLADYPEFAEAVGANHVLVGPMHASQLRRAVELPAARAGLDVEPELVDALIDDVAGEPGALPLLSTALVELWVQRSRSQMTLASYRSSGGVGGAVARLAEATYLGIPEAQRPLVRTMMLRLVGEGEDPSAPVRRRASLTEFDLQHNADADSVLEALTGGRLVTVHEGAVEVAHEALLREWPRLRDWIDEDAQARHVRGRITEAAAEWDAAGRDPAELYRGARLAAVLDLQGDRLAELNALERAFVDESRAAAEVETGRARRTNRRLRGLLTGVAVLLVAAVLVGTLAFEQRTQAQEAGTMQLAHSLGARALVTEDLDLSMLLARQAVELHDSPQTRGYLLNGLLRHPAAIGTMHTNATPGAQQALAVSPDGATIAIADQSTGLFFFDARTFEPIGEPLDIPSIVSLAFNPDGRTLAYGIDAPEFASSSIGLLDASTHGLVRESTMTARDRPLHISYSPDGSRLMVIAGTGIWGEQNYITIRDAETLAHEGGPLAPPNFSGRWVYGSLDPAAELLSDNKTLLTTSLEGSLTWWDMETGQAVRTQPIDEGYGAMAVSDDGTTIAVGSDGGLQLIDERTSHARVAPMTASITFLQISPDGRTLATTGTDGSLTLWDSATLTQAAVLRGHSSALGPPEFSPDGRTLYTAGADGTAIAWDIGGERGTVRRFSFPDEYAFGEAGFGPGEQATGKYSPDGSLIAVRLAAEGVGLVDADDLAPAGKPLLPTGGQVAGFAFSPDGRLLAAFTNDTATIWDVESRSLIREPFRVDPDTNGIGFSHDSSTLLVAGQGIDLFDVASGAELGHLGDVQLAGELAFSPTKAHVAFVRGYSVLEVWDTDERVLVARGDPVGGYLGSLIAFSPDGRLVAAGGVADPYVRIWDAQTAELVRVIRSNVGSNVQAIGFSADSTVIGMGGQEGYAALWDVESGSPLGSRIAVGRRDVALDFSPDGSRLLTTLSNGQAAVWDVDPQSWADRACAIANRSLTQEEWDEYLPGRPYEPACAG